MSAPPIKLEGDKTEMKPGFFLYTSDVTVDGVAMKKLAFWNTTADTQFRATFQFGEAAPPMACLSDAALKPGTEDTFIISLYPGEAKEFVRGRFKSCKRGLAFGPPDKAYQEKQAAATCEHVEVETAAMRAALKAHPSKDGRYTADFIASVAVMEGIPFVDLTFPPKQVSLFRDFEAAACGFANKVLPWKRPWEYCKDPAKPPRLYVGAIEPSDIDQGEIPACYFCCALSCTAEFPDIVKSLLDVPREAELGMYRVRLCKNGWWQLVTVDDLLPMKGELPVFAKNREEPNELWVSLIEKAYAKVHGSYQAICKGDAAFAVADFLGCPYYKFRDLPMWEDKDALFEFLVKCDDENAVMTLGTPGLDPKANTVAGDAATLAKKYADMGLVTGHAFSLIAAKRFGPHRLIKVRNPWGGGKVEGGGAAEWQGRWRDSDPAWTPEMKTALGWSSDNDGTFYMPYEDLFTWFDTGSVSHAKCLSKWSSVRIAGNFDKGVPDVIVKVTVGGAKNVGIFAGLHQKDPRGLRPGEPDLKYIGAMISVVQVGTDGKCAVVEKSNKAYMQARDLFCEASLKPAPPAQPYFILPQSYADDDKSFVLSIFLDSTADVSIEFVGYKDGLGKKINNAALFVPSSCGQKVAAQIQYKTPEMKGDWCETESNAVDFAHAMKALAARPPLAGRMTDDVDMKRVKAAAAKAGVLAASAGGAAAASAATAGLSLNVTAISGAGLESKDPNGKSDPYLVVAVLDKAGAVRGDIEAQSTRYVVKTLDPVWGDVLHFAGLGAEDVLYVQCFDKDFVDSDEPMGEAKIPIASLGLSKGASGKVGDYPLVKGKGTVKLMFSM